MDSHASNSFIHPESLAETLDSLNAALFEQRPITDQARLETAVWIADRQGLPGSYAGMFAPTDKDYAFGAFTFTGEPIRSGAGTGHILSEESCRALFLLKYSNSEVRGALRRARQSILNRLELTETEGQWSGVYCCGICSVSLWRHLSASGDSDDLRRMENGLLALKRNRDGKGRWRRFPFFYTLLALSGMEPPLVREEILYAEPVIVRALRRMNKKDPEMISQHDRRRRMVMEHVLDIC